MSRFGMNCLAWPLVLAVLGTGTAEAQSKARGRMRGGLGVLVADDRYASGGTTVGVECFSPAARGKYPLVLLLHGSGGLEQDTGRLYREFAWGLAGRGYVVLIPHLFDSSDHVIGGPFRQGEYEAMVRAVKDAVAFAAGRENVDAQRVGYFGMSMGAGLALGQGTTDPRSRALVLLSGPAGYAREKVKLPPTLILHGSRDTSTSVSSMKKFDDALGANKIPHAMHVYRGAGHNFDAIRFEDVARRSAVFFDTYLDRPVAEGPKEKDKDPAPAARPDDPSPTDRNLP